MAASKTSAARKPRTFKVRPAAIEGRPHELGGLTLVVEAYDGRRRGHAIEPEKGRPGMVAALGAGARAGRAVAPTPARALRGWLLANND